MKKIHIIIVIVVMVISIILGSVYFYVTSTPEYALSKTIHDINISGYDGLKTHLTSNAAEKIESIEDWVDNNEYSGILSVVYDGLTSLLKSNMEEITWSIIDVLRGKHQSNVIIGFDYNGKITGTIEIVMIKEGCTWKIDSFCYPKLNTFSF